MGLVRTWHRIHQRPWLVRAVLKLVMLVAVVVLVLYPKVWLVPRWVGRLRDLNSVLQPEHPGLAPIETRARAKLAARKGAGDVRSAVEEAVCEVIPYAFDWDTWGVMDYLPTVDEVLQLGREDCDGRAVVAASLLRRMGVNAWLVCDLKHVWVATAEGELMSPGEGAKTIVGQPGGTQASFSYETVANLGRGLAFGIAVFPLGRELIILATLCLVSLQPRSAVWRRFAGCGLLLAALVLFRQAGASAGVLAVRPGLVWVGLLVMAAGWLVLAVHGKRSATQRHA